MRARHLHVAAGDGADDRPGRRLDVVAAQRVRGAAQRAGGSIAERGHADAVDARRPWPAGSAHSSATCGSQAALRISVTPCGLRRREQRRLGAGDRGLEQVHRGAVQAVRRLEVDGPPARRRCARPWPAARAGASRSCAAPGKSPPGGARRARPVRPSSAPSSSTDPRSRPTSAGSGSDERMSRHVTRSGRCPPARPPRRAIAAGRS